MGGTLQNVLNTTDHSTIGADGTNLDEGSFFLPSPFQYPNETALIKTIAGYLNNNTATALKIWKAYNELPDVALGKGPKGDLSAAHSYWVAVAIYTV